MTEDVAIIRSTLNAQRHNYFLKFLKILFKVIISVILSLILIMPIAKIFTDIHWPNAVEDPDGASDLRFRPFESYSNLTEGFAYGNFNNEGYNNLYNYERGMSIDVLVMGSSHMLARSVMTKNNTASVLMNISGKKVYNIGVTSHFFLTCAKNLAAALKKYRPKYVVIESMSANFSDKDLNDILLSNFPKVSNNSSLGENVGLFRSIYRRYIRALLRELCKNFTAVSFIKDNIFGAIQFYLLKEGPRSDAPSDPILLNEVCKKISQTAKYYGANLIVVYHPSVALNKDGSLKIEGNPEAVKVFKNACEQNGIYFIDMSERFLSEYAKNFTLPTGFFNTSVTKGHLNKDGHRMFAEEVCKLINLTTHTN